MTNQLSLLIGVDSSPVALSSTRPLPVLHTLERPSMSVVTPDGRRVSRVCQPGYHKGRKPGNFGNTYPAELLTTEEVLRLLNATGRGYAGTRDRALYTLLWRTGARIAEALALMPKDVDLEGQSITILRGKGRKRRVVGLDGQTVATLEEWLPKRLALGVTSQQPVFCVISKPTVGKNMYASCVREQLRDCARRADIDKRVHPHGFRHLIAAELIREGVAINVVSKVLGHSNSAITARYIDHISPEEALNTVRAREWSVTA